MLAHQIFGLTDAFLLGTKPGVVMWMIMGLITGLYLNLAPDHLVTQGHKYTDPEPIYHLRSSQTDYALERLK